MRLSNLADYAVVLMTAAARHCGMARISAADLAAQTGVPAATAHKLVHRLVQAGLLGSVRGAGGGIKLARPAVTISLADIIEAVEGPIALTTCVDPHRSACALDASCQVRPHWPVINAALRGALADVNLTSLAR